MIEERTTKSLNRFDDSDNEIMPARTLKETIQSYLAFKLRGEKDVISPLNNDVVDVVTNREIIEVANVSFWKEALGRVLVYEQEFDSLRPVIYLFGDYSDNEERRIIGSASRLNVRVIFHG